uniref:Uncharacterized protein n=1 Tax=Oryza punctata TaxID=4537 RepID=A0A0E0K4Q0_ORYPU
MTAQGRGIVGSFWRAEAQMVAAATWVAEKRSLTIWYHSSPIPTEFTKQDTMASEDKFDLILRRIEEYERRREEADQRRSTDLLSLKVKNAEDLKISVGEEQSNVTPSMCSTNCSNPAAIPDLTMAAVVTCASTSLASMGLGVGAYATCTTVINVPDNPKKTHTKCSMLGLGVKCGLDQAMIAFLTVAGGSKAASTSNEPMDNFSPRVI